MMNTPEHFALQVNAAFTSILGRQADAGAVNYFSGLLAQASRSTIWMPPFWLPGSSRPRRPRIRPMSPQFTRGFWAAPPAPLTSPTGAVCSMQAKRASPLPRRSCTRANRSLRTSTRNTSVFWAGPRIRSGLNQWVSMIQNGQMSESQLELVLLCSNEFYVRVLTAAHLI